MSTKEISRLLPLPSFADCLAHLFKNGIFVTKIFLLTGGKSGKQEEAMSVKEILKGKQTTVLSIEEDKTVLEAVKMMHDAKIGSVIVTFQGKLAGIFTERDLIRIVAERYDQIPSIKLKDVMTTQLTVAGINDEIDNILNTMLTKRFRHMPVMDGETIIGLISIGDAVKAKLDITQAEIHSLREYMYGPH